MTSLEMRLRIRRLMREHRVISDPVTIPIGPPTRGPMILEGLASTPDLDLDRCRIRPHALAFMPRKLPPLLWKHDPTQVAGTITDLAYDDDGNLGIRVTVDHPEARRAGAFSIAAKVLDYTILDGDTPNFSAVIKLAQLDEVSLTDAPANPKAVVRNRYQTPARSAFYATMKARVEVLHNIAKKIKETTDHASAAQL